MKTVERETALGAFLFEKRGRRRIRDIADEMGVSDSTISRLERGIGLPDIPTTTAIHRTFCISYTDLFAMIEPLYEKEKEGVDV